ncbi:MAG: hypothetical protein ACRD2J_02925 [Thermoanaerobaculia bacterium]
MRAIRHGSRWLLVHAASGAAGGIAVALALRPLLIRPAPPGQPPSLATTSGIDASSAFHLVLAAMLVPLVCAALYRIASAWLTRGDARPWVWFAPPVAAALALWIALLERESLPWVVGVQVAILAAALVLRRRELLFSRRDVALIPSALTLYVALLDIVPSPRLSRELVVASLVVLAVRIGVALIDQSDRIPPGWAFAFSPAAMVLLVEPLPARDTRAAIAAAAVVVLPIAARLLIPRTARAIRTLRLLLAFAVYPLFVCAYPWVTGMTVLERMPRIDVFEDGHSLMPASEMLRGELPYRDFVPGHGLIADGLADYVALRLGPDRAGTALWTQSILSTGTSLAIYALAFAATGSAEAGLLAYLLAAMTMVGGTRSLRAAPALFALAATSAAGRRGSTRLLAIAGALLVVAFLTSLDFAAYSLVVMLVVLLRFGSSSGDRFRAMKAAALGGAIVFVPFAIVFLALGILDDFFNVTLGQVLTLAPYYNLGVPGAPAEVQSWGRFPEVFLMATTSFGRKILGWFLAVVTFAALFSMTPLRARRRTEPVLLLALWMTLTAISWAERFHHYYEYTLASFLVALVWLVHRRGDRLRNAVAAGLVALLVVLAGPTTHLIVTTMIRTADEPLFDDVAEWNGTPRAGGALYPKETIPRLESARRFLAAQVGEGETFFDFANRPFLYYAFDRNAPVRQYEVPFMQPEKRQRRAARALAEDESIVAVLVQFGPSEIDHVPNPVRAPIVWRAIEEHFRPAWDEEGVVFWVRK